MKNMILVAVLVICGCGGAGAECYPGPGCKNPRKAPASCSTPKPVSLGDNWGGDDDAGDGGVHDDDGGRDY
jgi:hypothetical protein